MIACTGISVPSFFTAFSITIASPDRARSFPFVFPLVMTSVIWPSIVEPFGMTVFPSTTTSLTVRRISCCPGVAFRDSREFVSTAKTVLTGCELRVWLIMAVEQRRMSSRDLPALQVLFTSLPFGFKIDPATRQKGGGCLRHPWDNCRSGALQKANFTPNSPEKLCGTVTPFGVIKPTG